MEIRDSMALGELLGRFRVERFDGWVVVKGRKKIKEQTEAAVVGVRLDSEKAELRALGWQVTVDAETAREIVRRADGLKGVGPGGASGEVLARAFRYFFETKMYLPNVTAEVPDPRAFEDERLARLRAAYDMIGPEREDVRCRVEGCTRGAVEHSVCCRVHHFEQVRGEACPFTH